MKKILSLLLMVALLVTFAAGCSTKPSGTLTVGTPKLNGDFINGFGESAYDVYVRQLLGYQHYGDTYIPSADGEIILNTVLVKEVKTELDSAGNKTYTFTLHKDLKWSDGSKITATDYVFGLLFSGLPQYRLAGAEILGLEVLVGYEEFCRPEVESEDEVAAETETPVFSGVKLIDEYTFSLTIIAEELPFYHEAAYALAYPLPMAIWAPKAEIVSDDSGAKLKVSEGTLNEVAQHVATTERFAPSVSCGPYVFNSFENQIVTLDYNPYFKGDIDGLKAKFEHVVVQYVAEETDIDALIAGDIDLLTGVIEGDKIEKAKAADTADFNQYLRNGYGYLSFCCDWGPTADVNVRWAISCLIDRQDVVNYVLGGYGGTVDGDYGLAQWMYQENKDAINSSLQAITFNVAKANEYLDLTEWKYEADGKTPFDASKATTDATYLRHNAEGKALVLEHLAASKAVGEIIETNLNANAPLAGIKYNVTFGDFNALLTNYYYGYELSDSERTYNTFTLALTYSMAYDPYYDLHSDFVNTYVNPNGLDDAEMDRLIMAMRTVEPGDKETYAARWLEYQVKFNELLPRMPLYSNQYFDIYNVRITNVNTTPFLNWAQTVCQIKLA